VAVLAGTSVLVGIGFLTADAAGGSIAAGAAGGSMAAGAEGAVVTGVGLESAGVEAGVGPAVVLMSETCFLASSNVEFRSD